jgi:hypothetical protein
MIATPATAFSGYGAGTSIKPYRIASCAQLKEIDNNLGGYYVLVSDINCSGSTFNHLAGSTAFTGTLDGQNHTIANLTIDDDGLFNTSNGATIKNLSISSGSVSGGYVASFVQDATNTTFTNIHSAMTITNTASYTGGLVGELHGTASISQSSFTGTINGTGYVGGLVGALWDAGTSITDSFSSGTLNVGTAYEGGIAGGFFNGTINRVYSSATINLNSNNYIGGLVGDDQGAVNNSFAAVSLVGTNSNDGGVIGINNSGSFSNNFFDRTLASTANCYGTNSTTGCTAVNTSNTTPDYFKNTTTAGPFTTGSWNFNTVWASTATGYPALRNLSGFIAANVPNSGDANGDGTVDSYQATVASIKDANGVWSTVTIPGSSGCTLDSPTSVDANAIRADGSFGAMVKYDAFTVYCPTAGATVPVTIIYDKLYPTAGAILRYYNPTTQAYSSVAGAVFGTTTIGGITKTTVTYNLTDGGGLDSDGLSNGIIVDPVAMVGVAAPDTGFGVPASPWPETLALIVVLAGCICLVWDNPKDSQL